MVALAEVRVGALAEPLHGMELLLHAPKMDMVALDHGEAAAQLGQRHIGKITK